MSDTAKKLGLFAIVGGLIVLTGVMQSWNSALLILNMGLISAIMALGVNLQWGFAGLFNVGVMGFAALGGLGVLDDDLNKVRPCGEMPGLRIKKSGSRRRVGDEGRDLQANTKSCRGVHREREGGSVC